MLSASTISQRSIFSFYQLYMPQFGCRCQGDPPVVVRHGMENIMPTFIVSLNWTDQGIRAIKDGAKRAKAAREMAKKLGIEIKEIYLTTGDSDLLAILDTPNGDNVAKFALALSAGGNVRTRTCRAWPQAEYLKLLAELP
jgi:uncharacterized protein with GYD domain